MEAILELWYEQADQMEARKNGVFKGCAPAVDNIPVDQHRKPKSGDA